MNIFSQLTSMLAGSRWLLPTVLLLWGAAPMFGQRFVLGKPYALGMPRDMPDAELATLIRVGLREKNRNDAWIVYSDRHNNLTHSQDDGSGAVKRKINFAEGPFYVTEEREAFIRIAKCPNVDGLTVGKGSSCEDYGWVAKDKMLLWNGGLINRYTQIHQKVFLLNKGSELKTMIEQGINRDLVTILEAPGEGAPRRPDLQIYSFYFVLKRENGYFLLAKEARLGALSTSGADIVGWVRGNRCTEWNTRVSLEPNFTSAAFSERKANQALRIRGYERVEDARKAAEGQQATVFWDNDPVALSANKLSRDARRFKGSVIRFPLLSSGQQPLTDAFRSCVIGEMPRVVEIDGRRRVQGTVDPIEWAGIQAKAEEWMSNKEKVNVLFAVQGTNKMNTYRSAIVEAMGQVAARFEGKRVRYGVVVYRNVEDEAARINGQTQDKLLSILPLTADLVAAQRFMREVEMNNWINPGDFPALYYGLSQGISKAGFNARETNVVIVIGADANYAYNRALAAKYKDHRTMVKLETLFDQIASNEVHLYALQLINDGLRATELFRDQIHDLINETAKRIYYSSYGSGQASGLSVPPPDLKPLAVSASDETWHRIENYYVPGGIWYPASSKFVEATQLDSKLTLFFEESTRQLQLLGEALGKYILSGRALQQQAEADFSNIAQGPLAEAAALKFARDINLDALYLQGDKYQLYSEVFFPRQLRAASHPCMSYVLFMPASDLTNYLNVIKRVRGEIGTSSSEKREGLVNIYRQLLTEFTGNRQLNERQFRETTVQEVALAIQGIEKEGVALGFLPDKDMGCLLNERCTPLSEIDKLLERFDIVRRNLEEEVFAVSYEFKFAGSEGNSYYWIPIEKTF